jgi:PKD repeat protein
MVTNRGSAVVSNPTTGELLFYTDGVTVWNRLHEVMPNGTGLMGDPTTSQSALIIPAPGRQNVFYVFNAAPASALDASSRCLCLHYSIVDMRADDGRGDVTKKNEFLLSDITEHLTATTDCKGDGWWIVTRSRLTRHFFSLHLTSAYLETSPVVSSVANNQLDVRDAGQLQVSPDNRHVLMTSASGSSQLFDFDAESGRLAEGLNLFGVDKLGEHFGAAFSPDGQKAYITVTNATSDATTQLYQFDIGLPTAQQIAESMEIVADLGTTSSWVPLQLGPDGRIYVGIPGTNRLSVIERPNNRPPLVDFKKEIIRTAGIVRTGLPNIPTPLLFDQPDRSNICELPRAAFSTPVEICEGETVSFVNRSTGRITSWEWSIQGGSPSTSTERTPLRVTFPRAGVFTVRLVARSDFAADTSSSLITVLERPSLVVDSVVSACPGQPVQLQVSGAERYQWLPAGQVINSTSSRPTVQVRSTTVFTVIGSSPTGCMDTAAVLVRIPSAAAGPDVTICAGATVKLRASGGEAYSWSPSTGLSDSTSESPVAQPRFTTTYTVAITSGSCIILDTVTVTVLDSLGVSINGPDNACHGDTVVLTASAGTVFLWQGAGVLDATSSSTRVVMGAGPTTVRLRVGSGGCSAEDSLVITSLQAPLLRVQSGVRICSGQSVQLSADAVGSRLRWSPSIGLDSDSGSVVVASPKSSTTYVVTATNDLGCSIRDTIRVTVSPSPIINAGADLSICAGAGKRLLASGFGDEFLWTPADGLNDPRSLTPTASPAVTTTYVLRSRIGDCEDYDSVTVFVSRLQVRLTGDTAACRGNRIQLRASGAWKYRWTPTTGLQDSTSAVQSITADTSITYSVTGVDALGCSMTQSLRIIVRDTVPIMLMAGSVTAEAGHDSVGVPVIVDVPSDLLPLHIDEMRATLVQDASSFFPKSSDRGSLRTSIRGNDRLAHLRIENLDIISPRQRVTSIRGVVLAGQVLNAPLTWENVEWDAAQCPNVSTTPGVLFVTGCNILGRLIRTYARPTFSVRVNQNENVIELGLVAQMPGEYDAQLVAPDGRTLFRRSMTVHTERGQTRSEIIDMSAYSSGLYFLSVSTPTEHSSIPVMWIP